MLARFFIDRPIFAWVLSIVITLIGVLAADRDDVRRVDDGPFARASLPLPLEQPRVL